jgi:O-antigen ligase
MIATQIWSDHPWWGVGPGGYRYFSKPLGSQTQTPDNMYALTLAENGTIGFAMRVGFLLSFAILLAHQAFDPRTPQRQDRQDTEDRDLLRAFFASSIGFSLNMLTFDALQFPSTRMIFWMVAGLGLSVLRLHKRDDS